MVFYAENIVGGAGHTVTVTASGPTYFSVTGVEYAGLAASNSLDVTAVNRGTGASYTSGAATIASANELLLGVHHVWGGGVGFTPSSGWSTVGVQVLGRRSPGTGSSRCRGRQLRFDGDGIVIQRYG